MRIVDDDLETLLTLNMSLEEDKRRRLRIQKRTARFLNEKVRSKANEIKRSRADPSEGIRALLYRIMVKLQYKMTKKLRDLHRRLFLAVRLIMITKS